MRCCGDTDHGARARALIVVLWRAGLRIQEALDLNELDLDRRRGSVLVRRGKGGRRREVGMDDWGFEQLEPWLTVRRTMPVGPLFCVINGPTRGRPGSPRQRAPCCADSPPAPVCADASRRTNSATRTRSSSPTKASRSTSSNANSATATSA